MRTLFWFTIWWYLNISASANNENALIFNPEKYSLIAAPKNLQDVDYNTWITACPAKNAEELEFQKKFSFYNAALFVNENDGDFQSDICEEKYKLSMAWFLETIEFGFEIYMKESEKYGKSDYDGHESLRYFLDIDSSSWMDYLKKLYEASKKKKTELTFGGKNMQFMWIPLFKVWFKANRFRKIEYQIRKNNVNAKLSCKDFSMGHELFYGADVDEFYTVEEQKIALDGLTIPTGNEDYSCESIYKCVSKWLLLPADQFQFNSSGPILCSDIATVPIWTSAIGKILGKLDEYLYTLSRISGEPLRIVAGVSGVLELPRLQRWSFKRLIDYHVYFSHRYIRNFTIRAPNVIYKIVKFKTDRCERGEDDFCWYGAIIIIHNNPYYKENNSICDDVSETWGWSEIKYEKLSSEKDQTPSKFIYVCKINQKSIEGVGLTYDHKLIVGPLSLVEFPDRDGENATKNIQKEVLEELKRLSAGGEIEVKDEVIERPSIHDVDFDLESDKDDETFNTELYKPEESEKKTD